MCIRDSVIDDAGLEFEQWQDFLRLGRVHVHRRVEPEHGNGSIVAEKLADLRHGDVLNVIIHVMALQRVPPAARHRPAIVPILCLRVIKAEPDTFLLADGGEVLERVVGCLLYTSGEVQKHYGLCPPNFNSVLRISVSIFQRMGPGSSQNWH